MKVRYRRTLEKYLKKKRGNKKLEIEIDRLITTLEHAKWSTPKDIKLSRPDADIVHPKGFYFFNISVDRTMVLIELEDNRASIVWCGTHDDYELIFRNNKVTIRKWLKARKWI